TPFFFGTGYDDFTLRSMNWNLPQKNRREFLRLSMLGSGLLLGGVDSLPVILRLQESKPAPFPRGKQLGPIDFAGESHTPTDPLFNEGLDARLSSDLAALMPAQPIPPVEKFYVRTRASSQLPPADSWTINLAGQVDKPLTLPVAELRKAAKPMGLHL